MSSKYEIIMQTCRELNPDFDKIKSYPLDIGITVEEHNAIYKQAVEMYESTHQESEE